MKLFSLRLTTLKSKLYAIVFASFVVRVVAFFALPNTPSALGPDEATYAQVVEWTASGKPASDFPGFGAGLYVSGRSLLLPATLLYKIGFNPLNSVRLTASAYGLLVACVVVGVILKTASRNLIFKGFTEQKTFFIPALFAVFVFLPSNFVWSILGLRESATEFWVISVFALLFLVFHSNQKVTVVASCSLVCAMIMLFSARPQVGWVTGVTIVIYLLIKFKERIAMLLLPIITIGIVLGYFSTVPLPQVTTTFTAREVTAVLAPTTLPMTPTEIEVSQRCEENGQIIPVSEKKYSCSLILEQQITLDIKNLGEALINQTDLIPYKHEVNKAGAASAIKTQDCPFASNSRLETYSCIAFRGPYTTFTFLFRPILGVDVTSSSSLFAAVENSFWLAAFLFVILMLIRNHKLAFFGPMAPSVIFFSVYSVAAGAYEGNMGTAFRHKSLILWVVLLLIASTIVATQQRKSEQQGISDSSQE